MRVVVTGACGRMGREVIKAVFAEADMEVAAAVDVTGSGEDIGEIAGIGKKNIPVFSDLSETIDRTRPDVMVDFTIPSVVMGNVRIAISKGVYSIIGTTGLSQSQLDELDSLAKSKGVGVLVAPNFAIGAILMMQFAVEAAKYLPNVEIIEFHHNKKLDAPSGTSLRTAELIANIRKEKPEDPTKTLKIEGVRGGDFDGIKIHSVRLPGYIAHQEVIFGGVGQTLTIRHDSIDRTSFMPGVILAIRKIKNYKGLVVGLENFL